MAEVAEGAPRIAVFQYPGGKARLAGWIADHLPPPGSYTTFVDVFGGAACVLLEVMRRNETAGVEGILYVYNDIDTELVNFFRVLREPEMRRELLDLLRWTPYSRRQFQECREMPVPEDPVRRAWRFYVINQQSYCGKIQSWEGCRAGNWGYDIKVSRTVSRWLNSQERLEAFGEMFRRVQVECLDFADILRRYADRGVLAYCDPPYHPGARAGKAMYRHEMPAERHAELAKILASFPGLAAVSGYRCADYDAWYAGWERHDRELACLVPQASGVTPRRVESLWLNPAASRARRAGMRQASLADLGIIWQGRG